MYSFHRRAGTDPGCSWCTDSAHHAQRPHHTLSLGGGSRVVCVELPSFRRSLCRERRRSLPVGRGPQSQRAAAAGEKAAICVAAGVGPALQRPSTGTIRKACSPTQFQCRRQGRSGMRSLLGGLVMPAPPQLSRPALPL